MQLKETIDWEINMDLFHKEEEPHGRSKKWHGTEGETPKGSEFFVP